MSVDNVSLDSHEVGTLNSLGLFYARATTDSGYKELALHVEGAQSLIARCLWQLIYPQKKLGTRDVEVKAKNEYIDSGVRNFWAAVKTLVELIRSTYLDLAEKNRQFSGELKSLLENKKLKSLAKEKADGGLKGAIDELVQKDEERLNLCQSLHKSITDLEKLKSQNLAVDSLFDVVIDGLSISMVVEMQVEKQAMAIRLLSYVCKVFAQMKIDLPKIIPNPVYGFALCLEESGSLLKYSPLDTRAVDVKQGQSSGILICNVYLDDEEPYRTGKGREDQLKDRQKYWKQRVVKQFCGDNPVEFKEMSPEYRKVYSFIELVKLSPLMTDKDVKEALSYLPDTDVDKGVFNQMYERLRIKEESMEKTKFDEKYSDLLRFLQEDVAKENSELKKKSNVSDAAIAVLGGLCGRNSLPEKELEELLHKNLDDRKVSMDFNTFKNQVIKQVSKSNSNIKYSPKGGLKVVAQGSKVNSNNKKDRR